MEAKKSVLVNFKCCKKQLEKWKKDAAKLSLSFSQYLRLKLDGVIK